MGEIKKYLTTLAESFSESLKRCGECGGIGNLCRDCELDTIHFRKAMSSIVIVMVDGPPGIEHASELGDILESVPRPD